MFYKRSSAKDNLDIYCKKCKRIYTDSSMKKSKHNIKLCKKKSDAKWYQKNKHKKIQINNAWKSKNIERSREWYREYKRKREHEDVNFKITNNIRTRMWYALRTYQSTWSAKNLGCSVIDLKKHLEAQFQLGMTWDNYGLKGWHIDHIRPLSSFDLGNISDLKKACHYSNLQPLWAKENLKKGNKKVN